MNIPAQDMVKKRAYMRTYSKDRREILRTNGICIICAIWDAEPGKVSCRHCLAESNKRGYKYRNLKADNIRLNKMLDFMAQAIADINDGCPERYTHPDCHITNGNVCAKCWRQAAEKAVSNA